MTTATPDISPDEDRHRRWVPSDTARAQAAAVLAAHPFAEHVIVPMYQPGKQRGVWTVGQEVRTVPHCVFPANRTMNDPQAGTLDHGTARTLAEALAVNYAKARGVTTGTAGYALLYRDGDWAVFESTEIR